VEPQQETTLPHALLWSLLNQLSQWVVDFVDNLSHMIVKTVKKHPH
jgi:hypothetical protein